MRIENPSAVASVLIGNEWVAVAEASFELVEADDGSEWFRFVEGRTAFKDHRALVQGPLASIVAVRSQADAP